MRPLTDKVQACKQKQLKGFYNMSTLDEVYKQAGSKFPFRVRQSYFIDGIYWSIENKLSNGHYTGVSFSGKSGTFDNIYSDWELYEAPKPKVKMWLYLMKNNGSYCTTQYYFSSQEQASKYYNLSEVIKPLLYTEIEVTP